MIERIHLYGNAIDRFFRSGLETALPDREFVTLSDPEAFKAAMPEIEVLFGFRMPKGLFGSAQNLRMIQVTGAGVDSILPADDLAEDVLICNASGAHEPHMPEFVIAMMMGLVYNMPTMQRQQQNREWKTVWPRQTIDGGTLCCAVRDSRRQLRSSCGCPRHAGGGHPPKRWASRGRRPSGHHGRAA